MPVNKLVLPDGRKLAFGRNPPPPQAKPPLRLAKYMTGGSAPHIPDIVGIPERPDWASGAWMGLGDIDGNDTSGDCCYAAIMHLICCVMAATGMTGPFPSKAQAWDLYSRVNISTGQPAFNPNDPNTDIGGDLPTVMNYLMQHSAISDDPTWTADGWLTVDATKPDEIRTAIWLFGGVYKALLLPGEYVNPFPSANGFVWGVDGPPDPSQGHCIISYGANAAQGTFDDTWGLTGVMKYDANAKYCTTAGGGEMHAILWKNWKEVGKNLAPNAIDYDSLEADLKAWQ
jgi:hypothetical protein